jgi:ligand-binding SRPBCC domain-containing protein
VPNDMSRFVRSIQIRAPSTDVWAALVDVEAWPTWASQFNRLELLDPGPLALGTRVRVKPNGLPAATWTVTEFESGRLFTWVSTLAPGLHLRGGHELRAVDGETDAEFWLEAFGPLGSLFSPVLRRMLFARNTRTATEGLKGHAERGRSPVR